MRLGKMLFYWHYPTIVVDKGQYVCHKCGSTDVEYKVWIKVNSMEIAGELNIVPGDFDDKGLESRCNACGSELVSFKTTPVTRMTEETICIVKDTETNTELARASAKPWVGDAERPRDVFTKEKGRIASLTKLLARFPLSGQVRDVMEMRKFRMNVWHAYANRGGKSNEV